MSTRLHFTEAGPADSALVARVVRRAFRPQAAILGVNKVDHPYYAAFQTAVKVRERIAEGGQVLVARLGEEAVGTVTYSMGKQHPEDGWIERLAVLPEFRGRKYGEALMAEAEERLRKLGAKKLRLTIVKRFDHLRRFYEKQGYRATETRTFPGVPFEVLFMEKET
jgi:GNAT superfamily N-acetyltransferase